MPKAGSGGSSGDGGSGGVAGWSGDGGADAGSAGSGGSSSGAAGSGGVGGEAASAGLGGESGSAGSGGIEDCVGAASFHVAMCLRAPYPLDLRGPVESLEEDLVVVGMVANDTPSCFVQDDEYVANPFGIELRVNAQRYELRDGQGRSWRVEMSLPKMKADALAANDAILLRWAVSTPYKTLVGSFVVEREGKPIAGVASLHLPEEVEVDRLEIDCVDRALCRDEPVRTWVARVTIGGATADMRGYTIRPVGDFIVANERLGETCGEFTTSGPVLGFLAKDLAEGDFHEPSL